MGHDDIRGRAPCPLRRPSDSSSTSSTFTTSPTFDTTPAPHSSKPILSTLSNLDISELDKSYVNVPQPSTPAFRLCSAYWTPYTSKANHPTESTSDQHPPSPKLEGMSSDTPLSGGVPPTTGQALPPNFTVSPELLFQLMQQMHQPTPAPDTPDARGYFSWKYPMEKRNPLSHRVYLLVIFNVFLQEKHWKYFLYFPSISSGKTIHFSSSISARKTSEIHHAFLLFF